MKKQNLRIGVRIPKQLREEIDEAVSSGKFNNLSEVVRRAVEKHLQLTIHCPGEFVVFFAKTAPEASFA